MKIRSFNQKNPFQRTEFPSGQWPKEHTEAIDTLDSLVKGFEGYDGSASNLASETGKVRVSNTPISVPTEGGNTLRRAVSFLIGPPTADLGCWSGELQKSAEGTKMKAKKVEEEFIGFTSLESKRESVEFEASESAQTRVYKHTVQTSDDHLEGISSSQIYENQYHVDKDGRLTVLSRYGSHFG